MQYPHFAPPDSSSLWHQPWCPTLPLPSLPTDLSNATTRQRSSSQATACQLYLEGMGMRSKGPLGADQAPALVMDYGADMLQAYKISFHTPSITQERLSPHKSNHSIADSGIIGKS